MAPLGLIAGGGDLPIALANQCQAAGLPVFIVRLKGFAGQGLEAFPGEDIGVAELGRCFEALRRAGCQSVCLVGRVDRPDFAALKPDWRGLKALPGAIAAARAGDDALLRFLVGEFEKDGFTVEGAHEVVTGLTVAEGALGTVRPKAEHQDDIRRAMAVAAEIGRLDIGQGAVVCDGLVLAVEAQEGTDAMLARCAALPAALRGSAEAPRGVLAKRPKPIQEQRVDMPTIGPMTVEGAARAGLAGIVTEAGGALVLDRDAVIATADRLGLFVVGLGKPDL